ncbi:MAG: copper resistance protein CopB, partial [Novosphingobium sp. 17-62-9]
MAQEVDPHAGHDMSQMDHSAHQMPQPAAQADPHAGHDMSVMGPTVPDSEVGNAPPPPAPTDHPADAFWDRQRMAKARAALDKEGAFFGNALIADRLEYRARDDKDGYAWQVMGWVGGDIDRLSFETEGEGAFGEPLETGEVRAAWRHAIDPWWNFELGA